MKPIKKPICLTPGCGQVASKNHIIPEAFYHDLGNIAAYSSDPNEPTASMRIGCYGFIVCSRCDNIHSPLETKILNQTFKGHPELLPLIAGTKDRLLEYDNHLDFIRFTSLLTWRAFHCNHKVMSNAGKLPEHVVNAFNNAFLHGNYSGVDKFRVSIEYLVDIPKGIDRLELVAMPHRGWCTFDDFSGSLTMDGFFFNINNMRLGLHYDGLKMPIFADKFLINGNGKTVIRGRAFLGSIEHERILDIVAAGHRRADIIRQRKEKKK